MPVGGNKFPEFELTAAIPVLSHKPNFRAKLTTTEMFEMTVIQMNLTAATSVWSSLLMFCFSTNLRAKNFKLQLLFWMQRDQINCCFLPKNFLSNDRKSELCIPPKNCLDCLNFCGYLNECTPKNQI